MILAFRIQNCSRLFVRKLSDSSKTFIQNYKLKKILNKMPIDPQHIKQQQRQRIKIKEKNTKYIPGTVNLQILGSGAPGSPASVYLFTDQQRYLFNCGEGTQRLAHEHKTKLARLEHIFMTRNSWIRTGGLPGLCLTVQDAGVPNLSIHGPPGLDEIFKAMRRFVILTDLKVEAPECRSDAFYDDSVMTVNYVPILRNKPEIGSKTSSDDDDDSPPQDDPTDYYAHESEKSPSVSHSPAFTFNLPQRRENTIMAYICKLKPKPGQLNLVKCVDKGVPSGPLLGQLKNGFDITLPNGNVVKSIDVRGDDDPGPVFIILEIPNEEYLSDFNENFTKFENFFSNGDESKNTTVILHFSPNKIIQHEIYQKFMNSFDASTNHLLLNESNSFSGYIAAHRIQAQLNQLNEHIFPLLQETTNDYVSDAFPVKRFKSDKSLNGSSTSLEINENGTQLKTEYTRNMTCYHLRPHHGLDRSIEQSISIQDYVNESLAIPDFPESLENLRKDIEKIYNVQHNRSSDYPKIVFLGTGSCIPNKTRNVSAILVHTNKDTSILLDCGEGTAGQIVRMYGEKESKKIFAKLKLIYISHLHADHHIGLIGLLQTHREVLGDKSERILLLAPKQILPWLYFYDHRTESIKHEYNLIQNGDLLDQPLANETLKNLGISSITTCLVRHCPNSYGVAIEIPSASAVDPVKITYSGDTMPCYELVNLGQNSTILIHEATMENELVLEARKKMHSTLSQAIEQGKKMNAKYTLLTHFSQRYAKLPRFENSRLEENVGIAFDNMEVSLFDLPHLYLLYPTLKLLFMEHWEEMEHKALKRQYKKDRELAASTEDQTTAVKDVMKIK